jgi:hypothetical protein
MKRLQAWVLIAGLAAGSQLGCSTVPTRARNSSNNVPTLSPSNVKPTREELAQEATKAKPSACIPWVNRSERTSKALRKAGKMVKLAADPEGLAPSLQKKLPTQTDQ